MHNESVKESDSNITQWKPAQSSGLLPVMIFLYSGGFTEGANGLFQYDGVQFVAEQKDIIVATLK